MSAASIGEIAIKGSLQRLDMKIEPREMIAEVRETGEITFLEITAEHAAATATLPYHHKDPFDRILVAQAQMEHLPLLTPDPEFRKYAIDVVG